MAHPNAAAAAELVLTEAEQHELAERPWDAIVYREFTAAQLELRRSIGRKLAAFWTQNDEAMEERFRKIYDAYPMWQFYRVKNTTPSSILKRIYGVFVNGDGSAGAHTVTCLFGFTNDTVGGTMCDELEAVDTYTADEMRRIKSNPTPGVFCDPLGFLAPLHAHAK
jgi:hypothetical protein